MLMIDVLYQMRVETRKLFVNCCRVHPDRCLQLLAFALDQLPQPLSTGAIRRYLHCIPYPILSASYHAAVLHHTAIPSIPPSHDARYVDRSALHSDHTIEIVGTSYLSSIVYRDYSLM